MDTSEIIVIIGGILLIAFVLQYFFGERESVSTNSDAGRKQNNGKQNL
ncbi:MAG: hypothetical protein H7Z37_06350 [Pyrinomonadaceae bacterium]|nr:hypothetical protein [Pyrinomonadaceae bacterium]